MHYISGRYFDKSLITDDTYFNFLKTYNANSLVGTKINAYICFLVISNFSIIGIE